MCQITKRIEDSWTVVKYLLKQKAIIVGMLHKWSITEGKRGGSNPQRGKENVVIVKEGEEKNFNRQLSWMQLSTDIVACMHQNDVSNSVETKPMHVVVHSCALAYKKMIYVLACGRPDQDQKAAHRGSAGGPVRNIRLSPRSRTGEWRATGDHARVASGASGGPVGVE
jgi:hypothetical protein